MISKTFGLFLVLSFLLSFSIGGLVSAQQAQASSNVNLAYVTVQLTYPSEVLPGQSIMVHVLATSRDNFEMDNLDVRVYVVIQNSLREVAAVVVTKDVMMTTGSQVSKDIEFIVPADAPRTSLMAVVSEKVRVMSYSYYYSYPYYGMYYTQNTSYPYNYYLTPSPSYMPSYDNTITPLSYVKATDAEYVSLQAQYQMLQQQLNQAQSQNQKLQQDLKTQQDQNAQLKTQADNAANTAQQLASAQSLITMLEGSILALVLFAGVLGFLLYRRQTKKITQPTMNQPSTETRERQNGVDQKGPESV